MTIFPRGSLGDPHEGILVPRGLWTPAGMPSLNWWQPTHDLSKLTTDDAKTTNATAVGDEIFHAESVGIVKDADALASGNRPFLRGDVDEPGSLHFTLDGTQRYMEVQDTAASFNHFHVGEGAVLLRVKFDASTTLTSEIILSNNDLSTSDAGISMWRTSIEGIAFRITAGGSGQLTFHFLNAITDTEWHIIKVRVAIGANASSMQIDDSALLTGTFGTPAAGDAIGNMYLGIGPSITGPMNGQIAQPAIFSSIPSDANIALWEAYKPPLA